MVKKMPLMCKRSCNPEINTAAPQLHDCGEACAESTSKKASSFVGLGRKISGVSFSSLKWSYHTVVPHTDIYSKCY